MMARLSDPPLSAMDQELNELNDYWEHSGHEVEPKRPCEFSKQDWLDYEASRKHEPS